MGFHGVLLGFTEFYLERHGLYLVLIGFNRFHWVVLSFAEFY